MNKAILMIAVLGCTATLAGCGTIRGIGEDLTALGRIISESSDHYKEAVGKNPPGSKMGSKLE